jgi:hypothetical protein
MKDLIRMNQLAGIITEGQAKKMMEVLDENKVTSQSTQQHINESFEDLLQQLTTMAEKGEIGNDQIKSIEYSLMSARRKGQSDTRKNQPGYDAKKSSSLEKAAVTRVQNKKDEEDRLTRNKSERDTKEKEEQERRSTNKLPLNISAYRRGVKGTKNVLGDLAKYYSERFLPAGPGGEDSYDLELKPKFQDQSFDNAQIAWNI